MKLILCDSHKNLLLMVVALVTLFMMVYLVNGGTATFDLFSPQGFVDRIAGTTAGKGNGGTTAENGTGLTAANTALYKMMEVCCAKIFSKSIQNLKNDVNDIISSIQDGQEMASANGLRE
jgi:hypothetical protein